MPQPQASQLIAELCILNIQTPAQETIERACARAAWFAPLVIECANTFRSVGEATPELREKVRRIGLALRAASKFTEDALQKLDLHVSFEDVLACAQQHRDFFKLLAASADGCGESADAARQMVLACASPQSLAVAEPTMAGEGPDEAEIAPTLSAPASAPVAAVVPTAQAMQPPATSPATAAVSFEPSRDERGPALCISTGKGAAAFRLVQHERTGESLLVVEAAAPASLGGGAFDWKKSLVMELTFTEMMLVFGVLTGAMGTMETAVQGVSGMRVRLEDARGAFLLRVSRGQRTVAVQIPPVDALQLALFITNAVVATYPIVKDLDGLMRFAQPFVHRLLQRAA